VVAAPAVASATPTPTAPAPADDAGPAARGTGGTPAPRR
jgi:hypothetical protein